MKQASTKHLKSQNDTPMRDTRKNARTASTETVITAVSTDIRKQKAGKENVKKKTDDETT